MAQIRCLGVLFDLDGVLVDSTPAVSRVWAKWAAQHGFDEENTVRRAHGRPSLSTIRELLPNADHAAENRKVERAEIADLDGVVPLPGALPLLAALPRGCWTIVTSCTRRLAEVRIRAAGLPLPAELVTADDVQRGKPDPEPYAKGAMRLGLAPADCLVLEDAPAGIRSGKAAGTHVVALRTTATVSELYQAGAEWIAEDLSSLRLEAQDGNKCLSFLLTEAK